MAFVCKICTRSFASAYSQKRHTVQFKGKCVPPVSNRGPFECPTCKKIFTFKHHLKRHQEMLHSGREEIFACGLCPSFFKSKGEVLRHRKTKHFDRSEFFLVSSAHSGACEKYRLFLPENVVTNFAKCIDFCYDASEKFLNRLLVERRHLRVNMCLSLKFSKSHGSLGKNHFIRKIRNLLFLFNNRQRRGCPGKRRR